jgi:ABC-type sulfate/molybdate transport systems ATPase subunit
MLWRKGSDMLEVAIIRQRRDFPVKVSFTLEPGSALGLFGASGSGKSTVLSCIAGLEKPDKGHVRLNDLVLYPPSRPLHQRPIGYLTQEPNLFPHLSVRENILFGVTKSGSSRQLPAELAEWINDLRQRLDLSSLWNASASRISGGQARRVSLARTLARRPALLLIDEPFTGLDRQLVRQLIDDLIFWNQKVGFTMIAVDHQAEVLERLCPQQALVLERGSVVQRGSWEELRRSPATDQLQSLLSPL